MTIFGLTLSAQGVFTKADKPDAPTCPRVMVEKSELNHKSQYGSNQADVDSVLYTQKGDWFHPQGERKDVSSFAAYPEKGVGTTLASLKGKVVLVGLWSKNCEPSAKMLMEFAALYPKRAQFGFELLAVNFDENQQEDGGNEGGWRAIHKFMNTNRQFFEVSKMQVYTPGLGKQGATNLMNMVYSVPVLFLVDRDGRLAETHIGYKDGFVGEALKRGLREKPVTAPAPAAAETVQPAKQ
jgi:thiol-disulfide isomerase/thioredoxin